MRHALILALLAAPALAADPDAALDGAAFEALVEGRTLTYAHAGAEAYGVEHYHPGRRVTWAWAGSDECLPGTWREERRADGPAICFDYDHDPDAKCWRVWREGEGLRAVFLDEGGAPVEGGSVLYEVVDQPGSLVCGGVGA